MHKFNMINLLTILDIKNYQNQCLSSDLNIYKTIIKKTCLRKINSIIERKCGLHKKRFKELKERGNEKW